MAKDTILNNALANYNRGKEMLKGEFPDEILDKIQEPKERIEFRIGPQLKDGHIRVFKAFIVRHNDAMGPSKGGIRMTPGVTLDDVTGLAMEMTWKCALMGLPFGGGKSGIVADHHELCPHDKETLIRSFTRNAHRHIDPQIYVPAPDMGTNETDMGYIKDTIAYSEGTSNTHGCYVTGKPVILGGIPGRREATGNGVAITTIKAMEKLGIKIQGAKAVVQGFGNVGSVTAKALHDLGLKIIAASDIKGAIRNSAGLDIDALIAHTEGNGDLAGFAGGTPMDGKAMLELPCDVLVLAASESQVTVENAPRITTKLIAEGANSPTTPAADDILAARGIFIIPDILCNAGGVFVSYLEYTQETQQEQMTRQQVQDRLRERMTRKFEEVASLADEKNLHMRDAAMYLALKTVCTALTARGTLP